MCVCITLTRSNVFDGFQLLSLFVADVDAEYKLACGISADAGELTLIDKQ